MKKIPRKCQRGPPKPFAKVDDRRSLHRALDRSAYLLLKLKGKGWRFPEGVWQQDETIRETAEKNSQELCGSELETHLLGNAPICHTEDKAGKKKWFLMHNIYVGGNVVLEHPDVEDFAWVTKEEFHQYFKDPAFVELLQKSSTCRRQKHSDCSE